MNWDQDLKGFSGNCRLFPLGGVVLFPHAVVALHIFEPRYRQMSADALASDSLVTIVQPQLGRRPDPNHEPPLESIGCVGRILNHERLKDGRYNYLVVGLRRVRLLGERVVETLYRQATAELVEDVEPSDGAPVLRQDLVSLFRELMRAQKALDPDLAKLLESQVSLGALTDIMAHAVGTSIEVKQALLDEEHVVARAERLTSILQVRVGGPFSVAREHRLYPPPFSPN